MKQIVEFAVKKGKKLSDRKVLALVIFVLYLMVGFAILMVRMSRMKARVTEEFSGAFARLCAAELRQMVAFVGIYLVTGLVVYYVIQMIWAYNQQKNTALVNKVENLLMDAAYKPENFQLAMEELNRYCCSAVTALVYEEDDTHKTKIIGDAEMRRGIYSAEHERRLDLYACAAAYPEGAILRPTKAVKQNFPMTYEYMKQYNADNIILVPVLGADGEVRDVAGMAHSQRPRYALELLRTLACPMSLAMHNYRYFTVVKNSGTTDALTGLQNRLAFDRYMEQVNPEGMIRFGCVYIDVNELHTVNNRDGHEAGDQMLIEIAQLLLAQFAVDTVYRIGGDEFVVISEKMEKREMVSRMSLIDRILDQKSYYISYGITWETENIRPRELVHIAEERMYEAKFLYYQRKEQRNLVAMPESDMVRGEASEEAVRTFTDVAWQHFRGVFEVDPIEDTAKCLFLPSYFNEVLVKSGGSFRKACYAYMEAMVDKAYFRAIDEFFNYEQLLQMLDHGSEPIVRYRRIDGQGIAVRVYPLENYTVTRHMLWILETIN
ncbi:MAG: GGDEF domain-containing protein [Lachnospiraceae bacterium]|nr:GGDEF domain-containing protein [Lachnospiraceae bacterium]